MTRTGSVIMRMIGVIVILGLLVAGGAFIYRAGYARGLAESPAMAAGTAQLPAYAPGWSMTPGMWMYPRYMFPTFGQILGIFFLGLIFVFFLRMIFRPWRWRMKGAHRHGYGHHHGYGWGGPPWARSPEDADETAQSGAESDQSVAA